MKAVVVIDMPDNLDIPLEDIKADITVSSKDVRKSMLYLKYKNVELKPLPNSFGIDIDDPYAIGWNACLDEITDHIGESTEKVCNDDLYESWMFFDEGETE